MHNSIEIPCGCLKIARNEKRKKIEGNFKQCNIKNGKKIGRIACICFVFCIVAKDRNHAPRCTHAYALNMYIECIENNIINKNVKTKRNEWIVIITSIKMLYDLYTHKHIE